MKTAFIIGATAAGGSCGRAKPPLVIGQHAPVQRITRGDVTMIIAYIRELQSANGIN